MAYESNQAVSSGFESVDAHAVATETDKRLPDKMTSKEVSKRLLDSRRVERTVIGSVLLDPSAIEKAALLLEPKHFTDPFHRDVYRTMLTLSDQGLSVDAVTLAQQGNFSNDQQNILVEMAVETVSPGHIESYARQVYEINMRRMALEISDNIRDAAHQRGLSLDALVDQTQEEALRLTGRQGAVSRREPKNVRELLEKTITGIEDRGQNPDQLIGVTTGIHDLDELTGGLGKSDLVIIAGRPSMGKTSFAMGVCQDAAFKEMLRHQNALQQNPNDEQGHIQVFSLEMPDEQLMLRLLSRQARVSLKSLRNGDLADDEWDRVGQAVVQMKNMNLLIDDNTGLNAGTLLLRSKALQRKAGSKPILIMVDYLQLMEQSSASNASNRSEAIADISGALKQLARDQQCPVVALSQLNRSLEQRPCKRPVMSDLRESGAIEQDADVIIFTYRDEVYNPDNHESKGLAELIIAKQRNGETGTVRTAFLGQYVRFENLAADNYQNQPPIY